MLGTRRLKSTAFIFALLGLVAPSVAAGSAVAAAGPTLAVSSTAVDVGAPLVLAGGFPNKVRRPLTVQVGQGTKWTTVTKATTNRKGKYRVRLAAPDKAGAVKYRVKARRFTAGGITYKAATTPARTVTVRQPAPGQPQTPHVTTWTGESGVFVGDWTPITTDVKGAPIKVLGYQLELSGPGVAAKLLSWYGPPHAEYSFPHLRVLFGALPDSVTFRVRTHPETGNPSDWSVPVTAAVRVPDAPTQATAENRIDAVALKWAPPTDTSRSKYLTGYRVYVGADPDFTPSSMNMIYEGSATEKVYTSTAWEVLHYFKIVSYWSAGTESSVVIVTGKPISPFGPDETPPGTPAP